MKKWFNSDSKVIFNIIIALILGIIFGNFLGNSMLGNEAIYAGALNYNDDVFILQSGSFYDETNAVNRLDQLKKLGLDGLVVKEGGYFYVYHMISCNYNSLTETLSAFAAHEVDYFVKNKKLYDLISDLNPKSKEYDFYHTTINYYLSLINDTEVIFTDDYIAQYDVAIIDLYNYLNVLNSGLFSDKAEIYKLMVYGYLVGIFR